MAVGATQRRRAGRRIPSREAVRAFADQAEALRTGFRARASVGPRPPWDTKWGFLKCQVYALTRRLMSEGEADVIEAAVRTHGKEPPGITFEQNPFHWTLIAIDAPDFALMGRAARRRLANELLVADRHNVPVIYLVGFLYQLGSSIDIHERAGQGRRARMVTQLSRLG